MAGKSNGDDKRSEATGAGSAKAQDGLAGPKPEPSESGCGVGSSPSHSDEPMGVDVGEASSVLPSPRLPGASAPSMMDEEDEENEDLDRDAVEQAAIASILLQLTQQPPVPVAKRRRVRVPSQQPLHDCVALSSARALPPCIDGRVISCVHAGMHECMRECMHDACQSESTDACLDVRTHVRLVASMTRPHTQVRNPQTGQSHHETARGKGAAPLPGTPQPPPGTPSAAAGVSADAKFPEHQQTQRQASATHGGAHLAPKQKQSIPQRPQQQPIKGGSGGHKGGGASAVEVRGPRWKQQTPPTRADAEHANAMQPGSAAAAGPSATSLLPVAGGRQSQHEAGSGAGDGRGGNNGRKGFAGGAGRAGTARGSGSSRRSEEGPMMADVLGGGGGIG